MEMDRREFGKRALVGALGLSTGIAAAKGQAKAATETDRLSVQVFSKHLQFLNYKDMAEAAAELGFDGVDLTVRPSGHVEPDRAEEDLPKAAEAIRAVGFDLNMFVSRILSVSDSAGIQSLKTAAKLGFTHYRMYNYLPVKGASLFENLARCNAELDELEAFNKSVGLHGAYQNHPYQRIGSFVTDIVSLLKDRDPRWMGCQYDIRHATVDGGSSWPLGLSYLKDYIRTIPIKDFSWVQEKGKWVPRHVPLGTGMVDFDGYFRALRSHGIKPLVSLHFEYELGGAEVGHRELTIPRNDVFAAMRRDLKLLHDMWAQSAELS